MATASRWARRVVVATAAATGGIGAQAELQRRRCRVRMDAEAEARLRADANRDCSAPEYGGDSAHLQKRRRQRRRGELTVGTQNIMDGCRLNGLVAEFAAAEIMGLVDVLCVQENVLTPGCLGGHHAGRIAALLPCGDDSKTQRLPNLRRFRCHRHQEAPRLATIYDADMFCITATGLIELPLLSPIPCHSRLIFSGKVERKHALVTVLSARLVPGTAPPTKLVSTETGSTSGLDCEGICSEREVVVVNLHLDAMGDNQHRRSQLQALANELVKRGLARKGRNIVLCGDTNIFAAGPRQQRLALHAACSPLAELADAYICEGEPTAMLDTHFFTRADEPKLPQQAVVAVGRLGLDLPGVFDIVATNMPVTARHHWSILSSDHDCVAATMILDQQFGCNK